MAFEQIDIRQNNAASQSIMDVEILDGKDGMKLVIHYTASLYEKATMERFMTTFARTIGVVAAHTDQAALTFRDIREAVLGKPGFFARLFGSNK